MWSFFLFLVLETAKICSSLPFLFPKDFKTWSSLLFLVLRTSKRGLLCFFLFYGLKNVVFFAFSCSKDCKNVVFFAFSCSKDWKRVVFFAFLVPRDYKGFVFFAFSCSKDCKKHGLLCLSLFYVLNISGRGRLESPGTASRWRGPTGRREASTTASTRGRTSLRIFKSSL